MGKAKFFRVRFFRGQGKWDLEKARVTLAFLFSLCSWTREKGYGSVEGLQIDLDLWLNEYNEQWVHNGKYWYGKTHMQTFQDEVPLAKRKKLKEPYEQLHNPKAKYRIKSQLPQ